jgi:hypothetical protein
VWPWGPCDRGIQWNVLEGLVERPLPTIAPGGLDADGDIDFQLGANGAWTYKLDTKTLRTGTFLVKFHPDASYRDGTLEVHQ